MKGIYLTEEGKKEIEDKIAELENYTYATQNIWIEGQNSGMLKVLEEILSSATILPVGESWKSIIKGNDDYVNYIENIICFPTEYPNGVIIKNK